MITIRNINERFSGAESFTADDLPGCVVAMASAIVACGTEVSGGQTVNDLCYSLRDGVDYEVED